MLNFDDTVPSRTNLCIVLDDSFWCILLFRPSFLPLKERHPIIVVE